MTDEDHGGWPELRGKDPDSLRWDEIRRIFQQIPPEDRRGVRWWLTEGHQFGEEASRECREHLALVCSEVTVRSTELLEPLIKHGTDIHAAFDILLGMDLESERLSGLNEQQ